MILIITLNPLLEERFTFKKVVRGEVNRNSAVEIKPGGKGINVSRQLKKLGIDSYNLILSGGTRGKAYRDILRKENFSFSSIQTNTETRFASVIIEEDDKIITSYFSPDPSITSKEKNEFLDKLDKMIQNCEMVVFSGSSPEGAEEIILQGIHLANKYDKVSVCDTYGYYLNEVFSSSPTIVHNNIKETEQSLNIQLNTEKEVLSFLNSLYNKQIKRAYLTDGDRPLYASNFDYFYKSFPPSIKAVDATGCGDSFVAGIIYGWHNNLVFEDSLRFATALASLNALSFEVSNIEAEDAVKSADTVVLNTVGKKLKLIDDSPH